MKLKKTSRASIIFPSCFAIGSKRSVPERGTIHTDQGIDYFHTLILCYKKLNIRFRIGIPKKRAEENDRERKNI